MKKGTTKFLRLLLFTLFLNAPVKAQYNVCVENGPHYGAWTCDLQGSLNTSGSFSPLSINVFVGQTIVPPVLVTDPTFNNGQKRRTVWHDCPPPASVLQTAPLLYLPRFLTFDPPIPTSYLTSGSRQHTVQIRGVPTPIVAWWPGENNANDRVFSQNGSANFVAYAPGKVGQAFSFNGTSSYISVPSSANLSPSGQFTVEAWVKYNAIGNGACVVAKGADIEGSMDWALTISANGRLRPHMKLNNVWRSFDCNTFLSAGTWYHVAMVYDGPYLRGYIGGVQDGIIAVGGGEVKVTDSPLRIGAYAPVNGTASKFFFNGLIDELSVYGRALSASEIQSIANADSNGKCWNGGPAGCSPLPINYVCLSLSGITIGTITINVADCPSISVSSASDPTASEPGTDTGLFTITRTGPTTAALPVHFQMLGTAVNSADYTTITSPVNIPLGSPYTTITLTPINNPTIEGAKTATLSLLDNAAYVVGTRAGTVTILDDDKPSVSVSASDPNAGEPANNGEYTITRTGSTAASLVVYFNMGGNAVRDNDYTTIPSPVTIPIGSASKIITLTPIDNAAINGTRAAILSLSDNPAYVVGTRTATVNIVDDEKATVSVSATDGIIFENDTTPRIVTIARNGLTVSPLPVAFTWSGAANGVDFSAISSPVSIPIGFSSTTISITPIDNLVVSPARTAVLTLTADPNNYLIDAAASSAGVQILDNELPAVTVTATDASAKEPNDTGTFRLSRSQNVSQALTVYYTISGAGRNGIDFVALSGQVDFAVGQNASLIQIVPMDNTRFDGIRDITLTILPGLDYVDGTPASATVNLADNEVPMVRVFASVEEAKEKATPLPGTFKFVRDGSVRAPLTASFALAGAVAGTDYQTLPLPLSVAFAADAREATVNVTPINDSIPRGVRNLQLTLSLSANAAYAIMPNMGTASVRIVDDELPVVTVSAFDASASETSPDKGIFRIARSATAVGGDLEVSYAMHGTATNEIDYLLLSGLVVIPSGQASVDFYLSPANDTEGEATETAILRLLSRTNYVIGSANMATVSIADNELLTYSWEATRPNAVASVTVSPFQTGMPGEIGVRRTGLLPAGNVTLTFAALGGTPGYDHRLAWEGDVLTLIEPATPITAPTLTFPAGANVIRFKVGKHITGVQAPQQPFPNAQVFIQIPSLLGAVSQPINFYSRSHVFRLLPLGNQVAENSSSSLVRILRTVTGEAVSAAVTVSGTATPSGVSGADHNLPASGSISFSSTDTSKDVLVQGLADSQTAEGWETIDFALNPLGPGMVLDNTAQTDTQLFVRDSTLPVNAPVPVDTDKDGMTDSFEAANSFNPGVADNPLIDTDLDGLTNPEEQARGTDPRDSDSNNDGITDGAQALMDKGLIAGPDTVRIKFAAGSCLACHQTTLKARPYEVTSRQPVTGDTPITTRIEKVLEVKRGQSYPIKIAGPILADVNKTRFDADYTAEILADKPGQPEFLLDDPNGLLGVNRHVNGLASQNATLIVPKLELLWQTKGDNLGIDDNINPITQTVQGSRIVVGAKTQTENLYRNILLLKIKTTPPLPGKTVQLKSFDVDDTTHASIVWFAGQVIIDPNGDSGGDNDNDALAIPKSGQFVANNQNTYSLPLDANGETTVEFRVGLQPGNNYRVAASVIPVNNLNSLQVADPLADFFVSATNSEIKGGFNGIVSPLLTVWRNLYLEIDSMETPATTGPQANFIQETIVAINADRPKIGQSTIVFRALDPGIQPWNANLFANGTLRMNVGGATFPILANSSFFGFFGYQNLVIVSGIVPTSFKGAICSLSDDDERAVSSRNIPRLPMAGLSAQIINGLTPVLSVNPISGVAEAFRPAYINVVDANSIGLNTRRTIPFYLNKDVFDFLFSGVFDDVKDVFDSPFFWAHTVTIGFQPEMSVDGDPNSELPLLGVTPENLVGTAFGYSAIYNESIADYAVEMLGGFVSSAGEERLYWSWLNGIIAHETGHSPGGFFEGSDHAEDSLMRTGGSPIGGVHSFSPKSILRFRKSNSWRGDYP